ncbi:WG containing repeat protein [Kordia sp. SMS9]|uniref:WG repeat-containing protein n=1 Tax=Kordia sp. SMS9 TaxID=2282170 RepID=UPI000E0CDBBF|nr:WG repeat-containing protein [Kordia sp. SMS9]AXG70414.1 WG containing repeat protein [Kordia sp. SMS9]
MSKIKQIISFLFIFSYTFLIGQNEILIPNRVGDKWGFKAMNGNAEIKAVYDSVSHFSHYLDDTENSKQALVKQGDFWGLIDMKGKAVVPIVYEQLNEAKISDVRAYYIAKNNKGKFGILHRNTKLTAIEYDTLSAHYDYIVAQKANKIGILELSGKVKIPVEYDQIRYINEFQSISNLREDWEFNGNELIHAKANVRIKLPKTVQPNQSFVVWSVSNAKETKYLVTERFYGLLAGKLARNDDDEDFEETVHAMPDNPNEAIERKRYQSLVDNGYNFREKYNSYDRFYTFSKEDWSKIGVYDLKENREIIPPLYADIRFPSYKSKQYFLVKANRKYGFFDAKGTEVFPATFDRYESYEGVFMFGDKKNVRLFSLKTGKKSTETYEVLKRIVYNKYSINEVTLMKVKQNGIVFFVDENMKAYYEK